MTDKPETKSKRRRTTIVAVTTMGEIPVRSNKEPAELLASLKEAEARLQSGKAVEYDPKTFKQPLLGIYRGAKR
jgi:hypothetical protein